MDSNEFVNRYLNSKDEEDFLEFESKVSQVMRLLDDLGQASKNADDGGEAEEADQKKPLKSLTDHVTEDNFIVTIAADRSLINRKPEVEETETPEGKPIEEGPMTIDKFTFMRQIEEDANKRAKIKEEQEAIAQKFRKLGNIAFRATNNEKAITMYTKAMEHVKNSPILYTNRALAYYRLRNYKRALQDVEYVLMKLDEKNIRAWMYRAACYRRLNDDEAYQASIISCKKHNPKKVEEIEDFVLKIPEI